MNIFADGDEEVLAEIIANAMETVTAPLRERIIDLERRLHAVDGHQAKAVRVPDTVASMSTTKTIAINAD